MVKKLNLIYDLFNRALQKKERAFLAKSFFKLETNRDLILLLKSDIFLRTICGFSKIPSEETFSRPFDKLHLDITNIGIPITAVVTGANVHDSQLAIHMEKMTECKVTHLYPVLIRSMELFPTVRKKK